MTGTLYEDLWTSVIASRSVLLRIRNVWNISCKENKKKHILWSI